MSRVYSTQLAAIRAAGGSVYTLFEVPTGQVAVVRTMTLRSGSTTNDHSPLFYLSFGSTAVGVWLSSAIGPGSSDVWNGRLVMTAGQQMRFNGQSDTYDVSVSGYLLTAAP